MASTSTESAIVARVPTSTKPTYDDSRRPSKTERRQRVRDRAVSTRDAGLLGGEMLQLAIETKADLQQMQASAAGYLDGFYKHNQVILEGAADKVREALFSLGVEIVALAVALVVTILD